MKKVYLLAIMLLSSILAFSQVKKVAILEPVDKDNSIAYVSKLMLRVNLAKAITNTPGYEAYDRSDMDAIMGEQNFQRTGLVSDEQIKRLGEMTGASYIVVAEAVQADATHLFVTAKILDVETARTERTDYVMMGTTTDEILKGCEELATKLLKKDSSSSSNVRIPQNPPTPTYVPQKSEVKEEKPKSMLVRNGREIYQDGRLITQREYQNLLRNTCPEAFNQYNKGEKFIKIGWWLFGSGAGLGLIAGTLVMTHAFSDDDLPTGMIYTADAFAIVGVPLIAAGVPILSIGYSKYNKSVDTYNQKCGSSITYNITAGQNGLGLAINF